MSDEQADAADNYEELKRGQQKIVETISKLLDQFFLGNITESQVKAQFQAQVVDKFSDPKMRLFNKYDLNDFFDRISSEINKSLTSRKNTTKKDENIDDGYEVITPATKDRI